MLVIEVPLKVYPGGRKGEQERRHRGRRRQLRDRGGRVLHPARPARLRQDDDAARASPAWRRPTAGASRRWPTVVRSSQARLRAGRRARHRHGVPVLRDLAAHDGVRERRLPAAGRASIRRAKPRSRERVERALELVGLAASRPARRPLLTGGQQQRLALARALVLRADAAAARRAAVQPRREAARADARRAASCCSGDSASPRSTSPTTRSRR